VSSYAIGIAGYCVVLAAVVGLELQARRAGSRVPSAGRLIGSARSRWVGRILVVLAWWWTGWHLFVR
jgi:hypothetical protein